jgi:hypothetical protein
MARNESQGIQQGTKGNELKAASLSSASSDDGKSSSNESNSGGDGNPASIKDRAETATTTIYSYRDYSAEKKSISFAITSQKSNTKDDTFPVKLHMILSNPAFEDIIAWLPHGRSWRILQQKAFEEKVIPLYFRHGRYSSFARQVNGWGFRRITHGSDYNSYYHEVRGKDQFVPSFIVPRASISIRHHTISSYIERSFLICISERAHSEPYLVHISVKCLTFFSPTSYSFHSFFFVACHIFAIECVA